MKKLIALVTLGAVLSGTAIATEQYEIDKTHTFPVFEVNHLGFSTQRGRFNRTIGSITLDRAAKTGSIEVIVDVTSLDMGFDTWNQHMAAEGFFNTEKFPTMRFKSNKLVFDGDKVVAAEGEFTLLGVTKPLKLTVTNFKCGDHPFLKKPLCGAEISATLKRSDFGMTKYIPMISDEIKISSAVEAYKQ